MHNVKHRDFNCIGEHLREKRSPQKHTIRPNQTSISGKCVCAREERCVCIYVKFSTWMKRNFTHASLTRARTRSSVCCFLDIGSIGQYGPIYLPIYSIQFTLCSLITSHVTDVCLGSVITLISLGMRVLVLLQYIMQTITHMRTY